MLVGLAIPTTCLYNNCDILNLNLMFFLLFLETRKKNSVGFSEKQRETIFSAVHTCTIAKEDCCQCMDIYRYVIYYIDIHFECKQIL